MNGELVGKWLTYCFRSSVHWQLSPISTEPVHLKPGWSPSFYKYSVRVSIKWNKKIHVREFKPSFWCSCISFKPSNFHYLIFTSFQSTVVEEEEDGLIYTVAVKHHHGAPNSPMVNHMFKIQKGLYWSYNTFSVFFPVFTQSTVSRSQSVKAGTEEKLVLHLLHSFAMGDSSYISIFLSTYRSFTTPKRVLDILNDRWRDLSQQQTICIEKKNT